MALPKAILQGLQSSPIILAKAVTPCEYSYGGELEAIKLGIDAVFKNVGNLRNLFALIHGLSSNQLWEKIGNFTTIYKPQKNKIKPNITKFLCR